MNAQAIKFEELYNSINDYIEWFNLEWHNGTGYLNKLTEEIFDEPAKTVDEYGRKIIVIPLAEGENLVVFQRYPKDENTIAYNAPNQRISDEARNFQQNVLSGNIMRLDDVNLTLDRLITGAKESYGLPV